MTALRRPATLRRLRHPSTAPLRPPTLFIDNHHYGHSSILAQYCGLAPGSPMGAKLQHGWQPGPGLPPKDLRRRGPKALWSSRNHQVAVAAGFHQAFPIGAPFVYLPPLQAPPPSRGPKSLVAVPFHGWERAALGSSMDGYADALDALRREGFDTITVCLYWVEYEDPQCRDLFEGRGFETVTMGRRDNNPQFLYKMRDLLLSHGAVTSNRVATAGFYALHCGIPFFLYGPPAGLSENDDPLGLEFDAWQRETYPALTWERYDGTCHRAIGDYELGAEHQMAPDTLRDKLMFGRAHRRQRRLLKFTRKLPGPSLRRR